MLKKKEMTAFDWVYGVKDTMKKWLRSGKESHDYTYKSVGGRTYASWERANMAFLWAYGFKNHSASSYNIEDSPRECEDFAMACLEDVFRGRPNHLQDIYADNATLVSAFNEMYPLDIDGHTE